MRLCNAGGDYAGMFIVMVFGNLLFVLFCILRIVLDFLFL